MSDCELGKLIYENALASEADVKGFRLEGQAIVSFPNGRLRLENTLDPSLGQKANFVYWCPQDLPADVAISWDFHPIREPGLCILFFAAKGIKGEDVLDPALAKRTGEYGQYHHGDINALHVSYFRRKAPTERAFHTCNLRKSYGFHLVAQGADPLPDVEDAQPPYRIRLIKCGPQVAFFINDLPILTWTDDGKTYGPLLGGGKIGFRQMAPLVAEYANLQVHEVRNKPGNPTSPTLISAGWLPAVHSYFDLCPESPDGTRVLYYAYEPGPRPTGQVMVATLDSRGRPIRHDAVSERIRGSTHGAVQQQWVDNGTIAYVARSGREAETVVYSLADGSSRRLPAPIRMFSPANGMGLATSGGQGSSEHAVLLTDFKTGAVRKLFTRADALAIHPMRERIKDVDRVYFKHTKWTDDGKRFMVVFTNEGYARPEGVILVKSILVADADGGNLRYLTEFGHHPMWSPDGTFAYAFEFAEKGLLNAVAYPLDGREPYMIFKGISGWHGSLSPDGKLFVTDGGTPEGLAILLYDVASGNRTVLTRATLQGTEGETGAHAHPVWSRDGKRVYYNSADTGTAQVWAVRLGVGNCEFGI